MKLTVKLSNGTTKEVQLESLTISVNELRQQLEGVVEIPAENQRIVYRGKVLKVHDILSAVGVEDGHAIHVVRSQAPAAPPVATATPVALTTPTPPATTPTQNPYAALFSQSQLPQGAQNNAWAASGLGAGMAPSPAEAQEMLQNPFVMQMVQQMMQNPQVMQQVIASNPMLQNMPPEVLQQSMQMMNNPQLMQQMAQMMNGGSRTTTPSSGSTLPPMFQPPAVANPREAYASQLEQLRAMGFPNEQANIAALQQAQGNIEFAIERLLGA